jgi:hypothetical protein
MKRAALALLVVMALAASAAAQNKLSGTNQCGKAEKDYRIDVGDQPGHAFEIIQWKCSYTKGEIAEIKIKEEMPTGSYEFSGDMAHGRFSSMLIMANGDKVYARGEDTLTLKDGVPQIDEGKWSFSGGTGKFKGLNGKGTVKVKFAADGTSRAEVEGEYELAK